MKDNIPKKIPTTFQRGNIVMNPNDNKMDNQRSYNIDMTKMNNINNMNINNNQGNFKVYESNNYNDNNFNNNFNDNNNRFNSDNNFLNNNFNMVNNMENNFNSNNNLFNNNEQPIIDLNQNNYENSDTMKILKNHIPKDEDSKYNEIKIHQNGNFKNEQLDEIIDICTSQLNLNYLRDTKTDDKIAQRIKQKYGGEWFVLICQLSSNKDQEDFDFKFTNITRKNLIIFSIQNFRFYVCRLRD